jgi:acyl-CoA reductase-like NAD-dependent aldehyde dehydrogenase
MGREYQMYINGKWVDSQSNTLFDDRNPFTGEVYAKVANGGEIDAKQAIDSASEAFAAWAATTPSEKRSFFLKGADILEKRKEEVALILAEETGSVMVFGIFQVLLGIEIFREAASQVHRVMGNIIPAELPGSFSMMLRQPAGVVGAISPWNAPLLLSLRASCFPIAYGNTVVLKPSAESPVSGGVLLAQIFEEAGFPKGVVNVITNGPGRSGEIGDQFIFDRRVRRITFTGSTEVGRSLAEKAGKHLKKISLELGGNDPLIILKDTDIDYAVNVAAFGRFAHQGQVCMSSKRIIVEKPVASEFIQRFTEKVSGLKVGDPRDPGTVIGPLINLSQLKALKAQVEKAVADGAKLVCGGKYEGLCYHPSILTDVTEEMDLFHQEIFGPVAPVIVVEDSEEALRVANDSLYGLSSGVITNNLAKGLEIAQRLETGVAHVNDSTLPYEVHAPMGGMKESGWGKSGTGALEEFTEIRWVTFQKTKRDFPF